MYLEMFSVCQFLTRLNDLLETRDICSHTRLFRHDGVVQVLGRSDQSCVTVCETKGTHSSLCHLKYSPSTGYLMCNMKAHTLYNLQVKIIIVTSITTKERNL